MVCGQNSQIIIILLDIIILYFLSKILIKHYNNITKVARFAIIAMISGGLSNLIDRIFRGYVIDYIDITKIIDYPIFNIGDISIVIGGILLIGYIIIKTLKKQENS